MKPFFAGSMMSWCHDVSGKGGKCFIHAECGCRWELSSFILTFMLNLCKIWWAPALACPLVVRCSLLRGLSAGTAWVFLIVSSSNTSASCLSFSPTFGLQIKLSSAVPLLLFQHFNVTLPAHPADESHVREFGHCFSCFFSPFISYGM